MAHTYKVKNKLNVPIILIDGQGDEVQLPPQTISTVHGRFIDFQLPARTEAEVIGYNYAAPRG